MRWQQQFGDTNRFAVKVGLLDDPAPAEGMSGALRASWGAFEIHVAGRCLTRSVRSDQNIADAVEWYLLPLVEWLDKNAVALLNEEPFPALPARDEIQDAIAWLDASVDGPPLTPSALEEDDWFEQRSQWWERHSLRAGLSGVAVPNIVVRRVADDLEVAWDNDSAPASRSDLRFVEPRGVELAVGREAAQVLREAVQAVVQKLAEMGAAVSLHGPLANGAGPGAGAWQWLLPPPTRALFKAGLLDELTTHLDDEMPARGAFVPHSLTTSLLRCVALANPKQLDPFRQATEPPPTSLVAKLASLRQPSRAPSREPWRAGYEAALRTRDHLAWGNEPTPPLDSFIRDLGVNLQAVPLVDGVSCAVAGYNGNRARILVNETAPRGRMRMATSLGHLILDVPQDRDFGIASSPWTHWPTSARARAFAAMLLMPEEAVRSMAQHHGSIDPKLVQDLMGRFGTGLQATTWHLHNLGLISGEARSDLVERMVAPKPGPST